MKKFAFSILFTFIVLNTVVDSFRIFTLTLSDNNFLKGLKNIMTIQDIASIFQIMFYIVGSTVAILTFLSAKKGLLNTVNTEYHKRSMDHLEILSKRLFDFFNPSSDEYWAGATHSKERYRYFENIVEGYKKKDEDNPDYRNFYGEPGVLEEPLIRKFRDLIDNIKSEPFLPETITSRVVETLEKKINIWFSIYITETRNFKKDLHENKYDQNLENAAAIVSNIINKKRYEQGCGISQLEEEVNAIRHFIRDYLKSFDPFSK